MGRETMSDTNDIGLGGNIGRAQMTDQEESPESPRGPPSRSQVTSRRRSRGNGTLFLLTHRTNTNHDLCTVDNLDRVSTGMICCAGSIYLYSTDLTQETCAKSCRFTRVSHPPGNMSYCRSCFVQKTRNK